METPEQRPEDHGPFLHKPIGIGALPIFRLSDRAI
jgi:hypothetical protein